MEENNKYYTPTIEEFHIGFEYQRLINNKWVDETYDPWDDFLAGDVLFCISEQSLRVKYLDKEDIESLGWYGNNNYYLHSEGSYKLQIEHHPKYSTISIESLGGFKYYGYLESIKNKSELKRLMKQLGIYE